MRKEDTGVETFISEDLLISLGAIRMALSWVEADSANGSEQARAIGIARLDDELAALQLRSRELARALRYETRGHAAPETAIGQETTPGNTEKTPEKPSWLTDLDAVPQTASEASEVPPIDGSQTARAPRRPTGSRRSGDLGHSIDELLISAMSDPKENHGPPTSAQQ